MKLLLNDKELTYFLMDLLDPIKELKTVKFPEEEIALAVRFVIELKNKPPNKSIKYRHNFLKWKPKIKQKIRRAVEKDFKSYLKLIDEKIRQIKNSRFDKIHKNIDFFVKQLGEDNIIKLYKQSQSQSFIKGTGKHIDPKAVMVRRKYFNDPKEDCLLRNTVGNENLLVSKIDNSYPFWFIDSGYTNFIENNKKWHRLVRNHLHDGNMFDAPVDRLGNFTKFPQQWRTGGDRILIIEPGPFAAAIFHIDIKKWKYDVEDQLRQYTDKRIFFREKVPKKTRTKLYQHLLDEDYYCVININSNAATEAIWAGIPVITLDKHITNPVSRNKLSDINDLYRPNLSNWLSVLSYSQFTYEELINGTAVEIIKKYHV